MSFSFFFFTRRQITTTNMKTLLLSFVILITLLEKHSFYCESATATATAAATATAKPAATDGDLFTAQVELESLILTEQSVIEAFEIYLSKEQIRLDELRKRLVPYIEHARTTPFEVVSNPINAFLLLKELSIDLDYLISLADYRVHSNELKASLDKLKQLKKFPSDEDLTGAASALTRLQDTYLLDTRAMARGELDGHCCGSKLSADDCFEVGRQMYNAGDHEHTVLWMSEALHKTYENQQNASMQSKLSFRNVVTEAEILEYLAFSTYQKGEISDAISLTQRLLELEPDHPRAKGNVVHYNKLLTNKLGDDGGTETDKTFTIREKRSDQVGYEKAKYESLCRGEEQAIQFVGGTKCQYVTKGKPYFLIGPVKEEIVNLKPTIYIYHDVMFDSEIEIIKKLSQPRFKRATVHNHLTGELVTAQYRISKSSWLKSDDHEIVEKVNKRIALVTGLELETAEELQVVNYGLGGHYEPHFDFARRDEKDAFKSLGTGNRIATFLFYMSDVAAGGATVFPQINLTLWPKKGAAAFWYNLHEDGVGDYLTRHAACPVLLGSKWVSNKWIHERGQEFYRPCKLSPSTGRLYEF